MSVLRAILGRFARFLVRIARRLDPALATTPYWVMPERMAALRQRYPGAPEHWLELVARHATIADPVQAAPGAEPTGRAIGEHPLFSAGQSQHRREPVLIKADHPADRSAPRFARGNPHRRVVAPAARPRTIVTGSRSIRMTGQAASRPARPALMLLAARVRNPIANLLRLDRPKSRPAILRFPSGDLPPIRDTGSEPPTDVPETIRSEHQAIFPDREGQAGTRPEWLGRSQSTEQVVGDVGDVHWPVANRGAPVSPSWLNPHRNAGRPKPRFTESDNRWPELPSLNDEFTAPVLSARDEAALLAEQIGGTWSA